jgi:septal ring factor EnvC (AmiA/AmiB activator)
MSSKQIVVEWKDLLIFLLLGVCVWFYFKPMQNDNIKNLQNDTDDKDIQIKQIQRQRDSLANERKLLDAELLRLRQLSYLRSDTINFYRKLSKSKETEIIDLREDLKLYNEMLARRKKEIDDLIENPIILPKDKLVEKMSEKLK